MNNKNIPRWYHLLLQESDLEMLLVIVYSE